jgi:serine/threonine-protein kinase
VEVDEHIGAYRIERTLGRGGFGVVYVGVDEQRGRRAAIKQLLPALSSEREFVERFFREARAAASIDHPGIVEIYDVGWHTDGSAYYAMKLLDGDTLADRLRAHGMLSIAAATTIALQVAGAVAAAHARGIVHRDLKPDNIMLVRDAEAGGGERAFVLDFGIAKLTADGFTSSHSNNRTVTGVLLGTPLYMSPEQCRGARDIDHRSDIYALGCIVFEMLAGRPPFPGSPGEVVGAHQFVAAPSVSTLREDVPAELDAVIARALAKEPAARFPSIDALADALSPFTTLDTPPPPRDEAALVDAHAETMATTSDVIKR